MALKWAKNSIVRLQLMFTGMYARSRKLLVLSLLRFEFYVNVKLTTELGEHKQILFLLSMEAIKFTKNLTIFNIALARKLFHLIKNVSLTW